MKKKIRVLAGTALASSLALGSMAAIAPSAVAAPSTTDCGPVVQVVCSKTWDRTTTNKFYKTFNSWWFPVVRKTATPSRSLLEEVVRTDLPKDEKERAMDRMFDAVNEASDHQGCLQAKWRKDKPSYPVEWTYTTGSECRL